MISIDVLLPAVLCIAESLVISISSGTIGFSVLVTEKGSFPPQDCVSSCEATLGDVILKDARVSVTCVEGDGVNSSLTSCRMSSPLVLMGVGLNLELLRRFNRCLLDLGLGSSKSSSHSAKSAEFFFVSLVISSSTGVSSFSPIGYRAFATSGGRTFKQCAGSSISYSTARGSPN